MSSSEQVKQARLARRAAGPLYPDGECHFCGYKVPPKAHWCSGDYAKEYDAETRQLAVGGDGASAPGHSGL